MATVGRPRDPEVEPRVRAATLALLERSGYQGLRVDDIARESGVAKTTIYRRWPSLSLLVLDTVEAAVGPREVPDTGDVLADLQRLVVLVNRSLVDNPLGATVRAIGADLIRQPELAEPYRQRMVDPLRDRAIELVRRGQEEGVFACRADPSILVDAIVGTVLYRGMIGEPFPTEEQLGELGVALLQPRALSG